MLRTNDQYKKDYIVAISEKRKIAVAKKRSRNKCIVCFCLAFFLILGVLSVVILNKPKKSLVPSGGINILVNTSSEEEVSNPDISSEEIPAKEIIYADKNSITNIGVSFDIDIGEIVHHNDLKEYEEGKMYHVYLDVYLPYAYNSSEYYLTAYESCEVITDRISIEWGLDDFTRRMNDKFGIDNAEDYMVIGEESDGYVRVFFDHYKLRLEYIEEYCLNYWTEAEHGEALAELKTCGISEEWVEKYGYSVWRRYDSSWYCGAGDYSEAMGAGIYTDDGTALSASMTEYLQSLGLTQHLEQGCIMYNKGDMEFFISKYIEKFGNEAGLSHEKLKHIVYNYMYPYNGFIDDEHKVTVERWQSEWDALWQEYRDLREYDSLRLDMIIYSMLDDIGVVCERNEYGCPIFDLAREDIDKLLTLPCAYDIYLLEKGTTPKAIYEAMRNISTLS